MTLDPPWLDGRAPVPERRRAPLPSRVDVCVIGGGIAGASALRELAAHGARALLVERERLACGATGRATIGASDPVAAVESLAAEAESAGSQVREGVAVLGLESRSDGTIGVATSGGRVAAEIVVLAVNAWAPFLHDAFGESVAAMPAAVLSIDAGAEPLEAGTRDDGRVFFGPGPGGRVVFGAIRWNPLRDGTLAPLDARAEDALRRSLAETQPPLAGRRVERTWPAIVAATCDGQPLVGPMPGHPRLVAALGFAALELEAGASGGRAAAHGILEGGPPALPHLSPWRLV
jgi:glycine/D-amino acid oxidase-like deaminating enzyme